MKVCSDFKPYIEKQIKVPFTEKASSNLLSDYVSFAEDKYEIGEDNHELIIYIYKLTCKIN